MKAAPGADMQYRPPPIERVVETILREKPSLVCAPHVEVRCVYGQLFNFYYVYHFGPSLTPRSNPSPDLDWHDPSPGLLHGGRRGHQRGGRRLLP